MCVQAVGRVLLEWLDYTAERGSLAAFEEVSQYTPRIARSTSLELHAVHP